LRHVRDRLSYIDFDLVEVFFSGLPGAPIVAPGREIVFHNRPISRALNIHNPHFVVLIEIVYSFLEKTKKVVKLIWLGRGASIYDQHQSIVWLIFAVIQKWAGDIWIARRGRKRIATGLYDEKHRARQSCNADSPRRSLFH
jgi:hypothetical protein